MSDVMSTCRSTWKRLAVPASARADLESELSADLAEAAVDGVDATTFVGGNPAAFAREWALARGLVRARWHVVGCVVVSGLVGFASLATVNLLLRPAWLYRLFDQQRAVADSWLAVYGHVAFVFLLPILVALAVFLLVVRDSLTVRTVVFVLVASPVSVWACSETARWLDGQRGTGRGALLFALMFALVTGALRATLVALSRRTTASTDVELATTPTA
jgi:hypothetical protein